MLKYKKEIPVYRSRYKGREVYIVEGTDKVFAYTGNNISIGWVDYYIHPTTQQKVVVAEFDMESTTTPKKKEITVYKFYDNFDDSYNSSTDGHKEYKAIYSHTEMYMGYPNKGYYIQESNDIITSMTIELDVPEGWIELQGGKYMSPTLFYGKYKPNLLIINTIPELIWNSDNPINYNLPEGSLMSIRGKFFTTKKGTKAFDVDNNGPHVLLRDSWGGPFNDYIGYTLPQDQLYFRRARSNGGGTGYDYAVLPYKWQNKVSIDDL